ncbi:MAG: pantoate--beta-alanine ligase [Candidatus Eisenbacteria bacterium]|uniref:Pantothenate synthetase n=1 Tax=Eiseniibacteriota bacterium TaxID=2212470 RepID=A0A938BQK7_UNCEI|nr:pantoate--beta-alanine ligase [Candidatus Eisenbacteria bacterium]
MSKSASGARPHGARGGGKRAAPAGTKRLQSAESMRRLARAAREAGGTVGFVPTMGALHEGHFALIRRARSQNDFVVVSIFVNPLQFGPGEDFEHYPRDLARDLDRARELEVDAVFIPENQEMYPPGFTTRIGVGEIGLRLCGASRPGHFDGVCTVVMKLLGIVQPQRIYLGQKDAQQIVVLQRMIDDLSVDAKIVACPTVREADGLAMSSRNAYLTPEERAQAPQLYRVLRAAQRAILIERLRDAKALIERMRAQLTEGTRFEVEYIALVDPETLEERPVLSGRTLIAVAARLGRTRLIDNLLINVPGGRMAERMALKGE